MAPPKLDPTEHYRLTTRMLAETFSLLFTFGALGVWVANHSGLEGAPRVVALALVAVLQGGWFHRLYTAGHEAVHRKMLPDNRLGNDVVGQILLTPLLIPMPVYRKIHKFHHTHNRRDHHTSTLDGYVVDQEPGPLRRAWINLLWYLGVFAGGYFLHGVISILLFLFMPPKVARKISPAFENWTLRDQLTSAALFATGVGFHYGFALVFGVEAWKAALGYPFLFFAWIYSLLVYVYHYRTTYGDEVWFNVRSVYAPRFFRWWLLNFNHHRVHHRYPTLPWHMLPKEPAEMPEEFSTVNENVETIGEAIWQQFAGPSIFVEERGENDE